MIMLVLFLLKKIGRKQQQTEVNFDISTPDPEETEQLTKYLKVESMNIE